MKTRAVTALFFTIVMLASVLLGGYVFSVFYLFLSVFSVREFYLLSAKSDKKPNIVIGLIASFIIFAGIALRHFWLYDIDYFLIVVPLITLFFILELFRIKQAPFTNIGFTILGIVYIVLPFCLFHGLGYLQNWEVYSFHLPLAFMLMLWANDTGAYIFGLNFGKNKLFERHSPKKTWEGFLGGIFTSVFVAYILSLIFTEISFLTLSGMALIISIIGTAGDLVESMLKRSLNVKDSGTLLPGHGGLLDRFDGLFISAPIVYVYLYFLI